MAKMITKLLGGIGAVAGLGAVSSETLLHYICDSKADLSKFFPAEAHTAEEELVDDVRAEDYEWILDQDIEDFYITSKDNLKLHATYIPTNASSNCFVLCVHGFHSTGMNEFDSIARFYHENGMHVLLIDQRAQGLSQGKYITHGYHESDDCMRWIEFLKKEFGRKIQIILHGVAMGASTVMMMCKNYLPDNVLMAVCDSGYARFKDQLIFTIDGCHLPGAGCYKLFRGSANIRAGFDPDAVNPIDAIKKCHIPILFIHGEQDRHVPFENVYDLYDACVSSDKRLVTVPDAGHAEAFYVSDEVRDTILEMAEDLTK